MKDAFAKAMTEGYRLDQPALMLGSPMLDGEPFNGAHVQVALSIGCREYLMAFVNSPAIFLTATVPPWQTLQLSGSLPQASSRGP